MKQPPSYHIDRTPNSVRAARVAAGLTQAEAAEVAALGSRERWAEFESGKRQIDALRFEWFLLLTGYHPAYRLERKKRTS